MSGSFEVNGEIVDNATAALVIAADPVSYHVGTATDSITFIYNGSVLSYENNDVVAADPFLYAALIASGAPITWAS